MLSIEVCKNCWKARGGIIVHGASTAVIRWRSWPDRKESFDLEWSEGLVTCPYRGMTADICEKPPKECPHIFEHAVGVPQEKEQDA